MLAFGMRPEIQTNILTKDQDSVISDTSRGCPDLITGSPMHNGLGVALQDK